MAGDSCHVMRAKPSIVIQLLLSALYTEQVAKSYCLDLRWWT